MQNSLSHKMIFQPNQWKIKSIHFALLSRTFNFCIDNISFQNSLKQAGIAHVHKKDDTNDKNNFSPVSILSSLSKALSSVCLIKSMLTLIVFFLRYNAVLKKTAVLSIIAMIKKCRRNLDKGGICGALFMDVSKTFDCLVHDFLLARLEAYGWVKTHK